MCTTLVYAVSFIYIFTSTLPSSPTEKELFYTDCQRWSYLFESYAVLSLMKIHKKPHVSKRYLNLLIMLIYYSLLISDLN